MWLLLLRLGPGAKKQPDVLKVAVVAAHGAGDMVLLLDAFVALLQLYPRPRHHVTLVCSAAAREFAEFHLAVDEFIAVDRVRLRRDLRYRLGILRRLARGAFSIAIQPAYNRMLLIEDSLVRATGAAERVGSSGTPQFITTIERRVGDRWYTRLVPASHRQMHDLERNAEFIHGLGVRTDAAMRPRLPRPPRRPADAIQPYVLFAVGSSSPLKRWPLRNFETIAHDLARREKFRIVFSSGPADGIEKADFACWNESRFVNRLGDTDLPGLVALIAHADLVVSNDSFPVHLAATLGISSVCILGGGIVGRYHPYPRTGHDGTAPAAIAVPEPMPCFDCGWRCIHDVMQGEAAPCIARVDPRSVLTAVLDRLGAPAPLRRRS